MKTIPTEISIVNEENKNSNPVFNCIKVKINDEAAGSFLEIVGEDEHNDSAKIRLDWGEWDAIVKVVEQHRGDWEYEDFKS